MTDPTADPNRLGYPPEQHITRDLAPTIRRNEGGASITVGGNQTMTSGARAGDGCGDVGGD